MLLVLHSLFWISIVVLYSYIILFYVNYNNNIDGKLHHSRVESKQLLMEKLIVLNKVGYSISDNKVHTYENFREVKS